MGLTMGVVAAPCIGPFVLGLLTWVASTGSPLLGFIIFFTLSLGLGLPLFFLAIFSGQIEKLPRSGEWMLWVRKLMGWVLLGMAAYFLRSFLPKPWDVYLPAAVAMSAGLHLGWFDKTRANLKAFQWLKTGAGVSGLLVATLLVSRLIVQGPGVTWQPYSVDVLSEAKKVQKPVVIDFYAEWCSPCRELEEVTFHDAEIVKKAKQEFIMVKLDLTRGGNPDHEKWLNQYGVKGVPTVVFLNRKGQEQDDLRLVDFVPPDQFLSRMAEAKNR